MHTVTGTSRYVCTGALGHTAINRVRRYKLPAAEHQGDPGEADGRVLLRQSFVRQIAA